ncbi:hypothetical protein NQ314_013576 [Rhamnusium bicolor]|uniref:Uncharacterized protein n=1 Tax=Rhamnusium bicolor TaxID=1586634 RepID=A0AAV8X6Q6_9CUCU|nr:hypothetical protein NQ314_013576 [Rhamnusium bicolor]
MNDKKWERILMDWVNCLKLCKPIQKLDDLKDGVFFSNLQKVIKKSSEIESDVLTCLFNVLNQHYPDFVIKNESHVHLSDLSQGDLSSITSLLMHYTCIYDRRDVLTSPLCHNLRQVTQVCVKNFLEKIQDCTKVTNEELVRIVESCVEEGVKVDVSSQWLSVANSPLSRTSPLQDILKTPTTKSTKLLEKDKEITRLKTELELTQDEKDNLEEDLKLQIEANKRLEKQLNQKTAEISRLRNEILALEDRTPPHYQDKDSREIQKILRTKVESLEQIIEQCDKENQELQEERDVEKAQVKSLESQCKMWLEKFIETDNKLHSLAEQSIEHENRYISLRTHCDELEALLEELRPVSHNESFIEESFQGTSNLNRRSKNFDPAPSCEDLAHSVVDVQLKDVQKENEELKVALNRAEDNSKKLKQDANRLLQDMDVLKNQRKQYKESLEESSNKLDKIMFKYNELKEIFDKLSQEHEIIIQNKEKLNKELEEALTSHNKVLMMKDNVCKELEMVKYEKRDVSEKLDVVSKELEVVTFANKKISEELEVVIREKQQICADLEKEICENRKISENIIDLSKKLNETVEGKKEVSAQLENITLERKQFSEKFEKVSQDLKKHHS